LCVNYEKSEDMVIGCYTINSVRSQVIDTCWCKWYFQNSPVRIVLLTYKR